jgi:hypothetical protein
MHSSGGVSSDQLMSAVFRICYMTESGCRNEEASISEPVRPGVRGEIQSLDLEERVTAKAIALLGTKGWQMVSAVHAPPQAPVYYFKRRLAGVH